MYYKYYNRKGASISLEEFTTLLKDFDYKIVKQETLPNGKWVSTVWLGSNYNWGKGKPLIFETMVFPKKGNFNELDCDRYSTEEEAIKGHRLMVKRWSKK